MANETKVQAFIHALEEGGWVSRIRLILLIAAIASVYCIVILSEFKGLSHAKGMDQAQVGRNLASGHGFSTKYIRPLAYAQLSAQLAKRNPPGAFPSGDIPDTYNAPLNPFIDSLILRTTRKTWTMTEEDIVYTSDRVIASVSLLFFLASVAVNFVIAKRLFDRRLALLGMGLLLICDVFWNFSLSGLPQMLMLLIFSGLCYCLVRAIECRNAGTNPLLWLTLSGIGFGLLVLAHGLAVWLLFGAMLYFAFAFCPRTGPVWKRILLHPGWIPVLVTIAMAAPWLWRTYRITGSPFGVAIDTVFGGLLGTEEKVMRMLALDSSGVTFVWVRAKVMQNIITQISSIYTYLGHSIIAPIFFLSLLHLFKRPDTASFRWCVLSMWVFALFGMAAFGLEETDIIHANDLHVLFIPMTIFYGLAFILVLWSRLLAELAAINIRLVRWGFMILVYLLSAFPFAHMLISTSGRVQWPPYVPPSISFLGKWTNDDEIIASDMPWAVAWYADRKSLLLPDTIETFVDLHDYDRMGGPIVGLYLTPVSGDTRFLSDIEDGEYKEWAPFILRNVATRSFPLGAVTAMAIGGQCVFYSDHNRWSYKPD